MKVAIVAESFLPEMNGVTHSLLKILQHLAARGDEVLVIAPSTLEEAPHTLEGAKIVRLPAVPLAGYRRIRVAFGGVGTIRTLLAEFNPDVVHLASPFVLGWRAVRAAHMLGIPTVAIYQTDVPGYAARYGVQFLEHWATQRVKRIHQTAAKTLVPSQESLEKLQSLEIPGLEMWRRGVDTQRFHPRKRSEEFRAKIGPPGQKIIGYVGRMALEKQVEDLAVLMKIPDTRLVVVGDGPLRESLETLLTGAHFTGFLDGDELAIAIASCDLFVHPGELETFGQTIQEAMASGVPVVATGRGGPVDLVDSSRTGWLYAPGNLEQMRSYVIDLIGDDAKRAAFGAAAFDQVQNRSWHAVCDELICHYTQAIAECSRLRAAHG